MTAARDITRAWAGREILLCMTNGASGGISAMVCWLFCIKQRSNGIAKPRTGLRRSGAVERGTLPMLPRLRKR